MMRYVNSAMKRDRGERSRYFDLEVRGCYDLGRGLPSGGEGFIYDRHVN